VLALAASLARIPSIKTAVGRLHAERLTTLHVSLDELSDLRERIEKTIVPEPPLSFSDGGVIAAGLNRDLDELRALSIDAITRPDRYLLLVESEDEVLDFREAIGFYARAWQFVQGGGDHAYQGFDAQIPTILRFCGVETASGFVQRT